MAFIKLTTPHNNVQYIDADLIETFTGSNKNTEIILAGTDPVYVTEKPKFILEKIAEAREDHVIITQYFTSAQIEELTENIYKKIFTKVKKSDTKLDIQKVIIDYVTQLMEAE